MVNTVYLFLDLHDYTQGIKVKDKGHTFDICFSIIASTYLPKLINHTLPHMTNTCFILLNIYYIYFLCYQYQNSLNNNAAFLLVRSCSWAPSEYDGGGSVHNGVDDIIGRQPDEESKITSHGDHQILKVENQYFLWSFHVKFFCIDPQNSPVCIKASFNFLAINKKKFEVSINVFWNIQYLEFILFVVARW